MNKINKNSNIKKGKGPDSINKKPLVSSKISKSSSVEEELQQVKSSSVLLATVSSSQKNKALQSVIAELKKNKDLIFAENKKDIEKAKKERANPAIIDRLKLDELKLAGLIKGLEGIIQLPNPVHEVLSEIELDKNLVLKQVSCPIGVIGVIFESRPDALVQIASLCLKSGNAVVLKGGSEAAKSNRILFDIFVIATRGILPDSWIWLIEGREDVKKMLKFNQYINLLIPRGSNQLVRYIQEHTTIPVLGHSEGICHIFVDDEADLSMAKKIILDAKCQYPAACNTVETLLVHKDLAKTFLPEIVKELESQGVQVKFKVQGIEYNDLIISLNVVDSVEEAIQHINTYGSGHTDVIITKNKTKAERFLYSVDSSSVLWNCSSRFSDGYRYGKGAEVGISTNKIHARGPVGMEGLLIYKYLLYGEGQIVGDYVSRRKKFTHKKIK